ncbi:ABC transporter substrate-binding protein [Bartonella sp. HY329]|uniref:ABC transporter substrate-binding protein n=1 Tax=unclassified Bartonella TaxID=2645622 RepID=UPI0021C63754|nr:MULTISPECIES: ABC transporter substrate-binding protein [unclassified Bartonella]UXM96050.1 ABC transporter substrate-binding protein [Bartonella sp. HY329]UXN10374.1 ABC transporter substrate-binding protein [Bartonella sp. HY328]
MKKVLKSICAAIGISVALSGAAFSQTTLKVHYPMPGFFKDVMAKISQKYMEENPNVVISFVNPSDNYEQGIQTILRQANTAEQPDVTFVALNRLRMLSERNVGVDLTPYLNAEKDTLAKQGFSENILNLAKIGDKQVGLAFATSNPIMYYNADLFRAVGENPDNPPQNWDDVIRIGAKIKALGNGVSSINLRWQGDDWMYSALLFGAGGTMLSQDEKTVAFNGPEGTAAFHLIERLVKEGGMPEFTADAGLQAFAAGKVGFQFYSSAALRNTINSVGDKFELRTAKIPVLNPEKAKLPTGGNAIIILTTDPEKQKAAWEFAKFAAGPYGASVVVPGTGYVPNNELAATSPEYLGTFYEENPLFKPSLEQMPLMTPWYAFPGSNGVRITQAIVDNIARIVGGTADADTARDDAAAEVQKLLPRR